MNSSRTAVPTSAGVAGGTGRQRLPLVVPVLALGAFLMLTTEFVVAGLLQPMAQDLGVSLARAGVLITVFAVGMVLGAPTMAMATLRLQHRVTMVAALLVFALGHAVIALSTSFAVLASARFVTAVATGAFWAVANVAATRAAGPARAARAVGVVTAGGMLATVLGVPFGAVIGQHLGWHGAFWALAGAAILVALVVARHVPREDTDRPAVSIAGELSCLGSGRLWLTLAICAFTTGGTLTTYSFITPLLTDRAGVPAGRVPLVLAAFGVGALLGMLIGGWAGDHRPHATTVVVPALTSIVLLALFLLSDQSTPTVVLVALLGLFGLSANPVLTTFAVRFAASAPTLGSSLAVSAFNLGTALGTGAAGALLASPLGVRAPVTLGAAVTVVTIVPAIFLLLVQRRRAEQPPPIDDTGDDTGDDTSGEHLQ